MEENKTPKLLLLTTMRKSSAKRIRKIIGPINNSITRRVYRRLKREYTRLSKQDKTKFNEGAAQLSSPIGV